MKLRARIRLPLTGRRRETRRNRRTGLQLLGHYCRSLSGEAVPLVEVGDQAEMLPAGMPRWRTITSATSQARQKIPFCTPPTDRNEGSFSYITNAATCALHVGYAVTVRDGN